MNPRDLKIFIWVGGSRGGAEAVMLAVADFLHTHYGVIPTLGLFRGEKVERAWAPKIYVPRILPVRLVGYNYILASLWLGERLAAYDLVVTHVGGWWQRGKNTFIYREPGDLDAMMRALPWSSKLVYWWPYMIAKVSLTRLSNLPIAASQRAQDFFQRIGVKQFLATTNFIDTKQLLGLQPRIYTQGDNLNLVFVGRDDALKNLPALIAVCEQIELSNIRLHIFGVEGVSTERIIYHGWCQQAQIEEFLVSSAHLFVLPSKFEASPLSLLTALAYGVPSLVAKNALPLEYNHIVDSFGDFKELGNQILAIEHDYQRVTERFYRFASEVRNKYDVERVLSQEMDSIVQVLNQQL